MIAPDATRTWEQMLADEPAASICRTLAGELSARKLTFGGRPLCPFARPFFITPDDEARMRTAAELLARLGERVAKAAIEDRSLFTELGIRDDEARLIAIEPGYPLASTTSRADAFLLANSVQFAEYNAESPAGAGYSERLGDAFEALPLMRRFRTRYDATPFRPIRPLLDALLASYRDWGGTASPPTIAIVDWREVPTWTEFELLQAAFADAGVPTVIADPRDLSFEGGRLRAGSRAIDLVYRRVLINDIVSRANECRALVDAYAARAVCVANALRCKLPHKKAFFAVLTDERRESLFTAAERAVIRTHVPWTRLLRDARTSRDGASVELLAHVRAGRDGLVLKPNDEYGGAGVTLGWETDEREWDRAIERALADAPGTWIVQERIAVRREEFPVCGADGSIVARNLLVDLAPYLFRGRLAGFLIRLSATGLANVTSGGGQVPAFVVTSR